MSGVIDTAVQVVTAIGGAAGIGAVFQIGIKRRQEKANASKTEVDATKVIVDTALSMVTPLKASSAHLAGELVESRVEAERLRDDVHRIAEELATSQATVTRLRADVRALHEFVTELLDTLRAAGQPTPPRPFTSEPPPPAHRRRPRKDTTS